MYILYSYDTRRAVGVVGVVMDWNYFFDDWATVVRVRAADVCTYVPRGLEGRVSCGFVRAGNSVFRLDGSLGGG